MKSNLSVYLSLTLASAGLAGCGGGVIPGAPLTRLQELSQSVGCQNVANLSSDVASLIQASNAFGFQVFQNGALSEETGTNRMMSTLSLTQALQMLLVGSANATQTQLATALRLAGQTSAQVSSSVQSLLATLGCRKGYTLQVADSLWSDGNIQVLPSYRQTLTNDFAAQVDFDPSLTAAQINQWVSQNTNGMIPQLVSRLSSDDLLLVNAIYFNGLWGKPFNPAQPAAFTLTGGQVVQAPTLQDERTIQSGTWKGFSVAAIPYGFASSSSSADASLILLLPANGQSPQQALASLSAADYVSLGTEMATWPSSPVSLSFPKFSFTKAFDLVSYMKGPSSGLSFLLSPGLDLSAMTSTGGVSLGSVSQQTRIEVSETGTQAAAATEDGVASASAPTSVLTSFIVDQPFIFILRDATGMDLFIGAVNDPTSQDSQ